METSTLMSPYGTYIDRPRGVMYQFTNTLMLGMNDCAFYTVMFDHVQCTANDGILIDDVCLDR